MLTLHEKRGDGGLGNADRTDKDAFKRATMGIFFKLIFFYFKIILIKNKITFVTILFYLDKARHGGLGKC